MKLVFAHDHKLREINGKYYTLGGLADSITGRYMEFFDELIVFCRAIEKQPFDTQLFELKNPAVIVKPVSNGSLILSRDAKKMMEDEISKADALIVKLHSKIAEYAICYARKYGIPYLVESVGCPWDAYWNHSFKGKLVAPFMTLSTKREIKRAPFVLYVTKEFLQHRYPTNGKNIDCSDVVLLEQDENILSQRLEKIDHTDCNSLILGTLAQLDVLYKGQEYVIYALAKLKKQGKRFRYRLAGSGDTSRLHKIAEEYDVIDQIDFCGVISHDEVFNWLDSIDFYIQPSKQEGLPRAMVEAISRACPAAGANTGGIGELVEKEYIFKKGCPDAISSLLFSLNRGKLRQQAKQNYARSMNYQKKFLDEKRKNFYKAFAEYCQKG